MEDIRIIEFEPQYAQEVKTFVRSVLSSLGINAGNDPVISRESDLENITDTYKDKGRFWIAIKENQIVGTVAILELGEETAKLKRMFVLPELQGTGLGQRLLDTAIQFAQKNNYTKIKLNTGKVMVRAQKFYEKNGFHKTGENEKQFHYERDIN